MKASLYEYDEKKTQEILKRQYMREGREEEGLKRLLAYLRDVLKFRFNADPDETTAPLRDKSLEEFDALSANVFERPSFEGFRAQVQLVRNGFSFCSLKSATRADFTSTRIRGRADGSRRVN
ncbi:MAG: hypothetical protein IJM30_02445 [Thermoguttaceae bacterium]|nr:hypothetical protein [Thermoguttaceae bacterium]